MRRLLVGAVALTAIAAALASTPAIAGGPTDPNGGEVGLGVAGGLKYVTESHDVGTGGTQTPPYDATQIACGPHVDSPWHVTSGGAAVQAPAQQTTLTVLRPMDLDAAFESPDNAAPDDWWDSDVKSVVGHSLSGFAICSKKASHYVLHPTPSGTHSGRTDTATCAPGDEVVGGGLIIATSDSFINASYPVQGAWKVRAFDTVGGSGGMDTYAVCRPNASIDSQIGAVEHASVAPGAAAASTSWCSNSRHVIGGGGRLTGHIGAGWLSASRPVDSPSDADSVPDDGWKVVGYNASGHAKSLWAYAICVTSG